MDYGCGSGILAIAAAKLGAARVAGMDIDPAAIEAAADNASRNEVSIDWGTAEDVPVGPFDIVVANILANPLRLLAPALARLLGPGGRLALAGILSSQRDELLAVYDEHFEMRVFDEQDGWVCLEGTRRGAARS
jgi:ribosomal protein L11 methyltransferase